MRGEDSALAPCRVVAAEGLLRQTRSDADPIGPVLTLGDLIPYTLISLLV